MTTEAMKSAGIALATVVVLSVLSFVSPIASSDVIEQVNIDGVNDVRNDASPQNDTSVREDQRADQSIGQIGQAEWNEQAINDLLQYASGQERSERKEVVVYAPRWCGLCQVLKQRLGDGDDSLKVTWIEGEAPWQAKGYPAIYSPERNEYLFGLRSSNGVEHNLESIKRWLGVPQSVRSYSAFRVATLPWKAQLEDVLTYARKVQGNNGSLTLTSTSTQRRSIVLHNLVEVVIGASAQAEVSVREQRTAVKLKDVALRIAGTVDVFVPHVEYANGLMTLTLDGLPDVQIAWR